MIWIEGEKLNQNTVFNVANKFELCYIQINKGSKHALYKHFLFWMETISSWLCHLLAASLFCYSVIHRFKHSMEEYCQFLSFLYFSPGDGTIGCGRPRISCAKCRQFRAKLSFISRRTCNDGSPLILFL